MNTTIVKLFCYALACSIMLGACKKEDSVTLPQPNPVIETPSDGTKPDLLVVETQPAIQTAVTANISNNCGGYYKALPARYDSTSAKYPLMIFIHGQSALGNGSASALTKISGGPYSLLKSKKFPPNFTVKGSNYSFIVVSPQFKAWPTADDVEAVVNYFVKNLRVDASRIYVTGLSMGGGATWDYAGKFASQVAAIAPVCGASTPSDAKAKIIADNKLPVWAFHNKDDDKVSVNNSTGYITKINSHKQSPSPKLTLWDTGGHDAWSKAYNLTYKESSMNVYEWMLQYKR